MEGFMINKTNPAGVTRELNTNLISCLCLQSFHFPIVAAGGILCIQIQLIILSKKTHLHSCYLIFTAVP